MFALCDNGSMGSGSLNIAAGWFVLFTVIKVPEGDSGSQEEITRIFFDKLGCSSCELGLGA